MEPEGSLPRLQVPATCPYPKPDHSFLWDIVSNMHHCNGNSGIYLHLVSNKIIKTQIE
jgi:hypothetical protein